MRSQREQMKKLGVKERKLARLFFNKQTSEADFKFLNYMYEERQHLNFFYAGGGSLGASLLVNYGLFRHNTFSYQFAFTCSVFLMAHIITKRRVEYRFNSLIDPYFEKYEIK